MAGALKRNVSLAPKSLGVTSVPSNSLGQKEAGTRMDPERRAIRPTVYALGSLGIVKLPLGLVKRGECSNSPPFALPAAVTRLAHQLEGAPAVGEDHCLVGRRVDLDVMHCGGGQT
jgi:hypothetical protein